MSPLDDPRWSPRVCAAPNCLAPRANRESRYCVQCGQRPPLGTLGPTTSEAWSYHDAGATRLAGGR